MTTTESTTVITRAEWQAKARQLGNGEIIDARLLCISCGTIFTPRQFAAAGGDPRSAPQQCIGRPIAAAAGPRKPKVTGNTKPCNWATFGMIELPGLVTVRMEDGKEILVWPFADEYQPAVHA